MRRPLETPDNKYFCGEPERVGLVDDVPPSPTPDWADIARAAWDAASWQAAPAEYHNKNHQSAAKIEPPRPQCLRHLMDNDLSPERALSELNDQRRRGEATATTVEALMPTVLRDERRS
jgi:hypothetical protein